MNATTAISSAAHDGLEGAAAIAAFLAERLGPTWTVHRVYNIVRVKSGWPIWHEPGIGLMTTKSALLEHLAERARQAQSAGPGGQAPVDSAP